jgi:dipeptidyl aminopeptidase/acylaminoacyl peptidase
MRTRVFAAIAATFIGVSAAAQTPARFTVEDMLAVRTFAGGQPVAVSSTGRWIAYVLTELDDEWNIQEARPTGHVHVQPLGTQGGAPRAFSSGAVRTSFPVWSPDGRRLAFIREENGVGRTVIWDAERDQLTPVGETFAARLSMAPQWHPSGTTLFVAAALPDAPPAPYRVRSVKSTDARIPGDQFFVNDSTSRLVAIDTERGSAAALTPDPIALRSFQVSPTGRHILYVSPSPDTLGIIGKEQNDTYVLAVPGAGQPSAPARRLSERGRISWSPDGEQLSLVRAGRLMVMPAEGGEPKPWLEAFTLSITEPVWAPDRRRFATLVADPSITDPEVEPVSAGMYTTAQPFMDVYIVQADGTHRNLTAGFADQVSGLVWSPDGSALFFRAVDNSSYNEKIYRYTVADQRLETIADGEESYGRLQSTPAGLLVAIEAATRPNDLWLITSAGPRTRITDLNPQLARFSFSKPELFHFDNADGERLAALLYRPTALAPDQKVPVITWVYEKMTPNRHRFSARDQMYISHGYALLMPNVKVKVGRTADSFEKCVVPAVNAVRQMGFTNGKFGLWGHSFGGYATSNLITRTSIFAAAISSATPPELFRNWASGRDRDSRNIETGQARMGGNPYEYPERYFSQSAFFHLDKVTTPVLILHGEKDLTILFGEGEMMFYALRRLGKTAELVSYANGDHSLSRHSRADAIDVNRRVLEWFARYLQPPSDGRRTQ